MDWIPLISKFYWGEISPSMGWARSDASWGWGSPHYRKPWGPSSNSTLCRVELYKYDEAVIQVQHLNLDQRDYDLEGVDWGSPEYHRGTKTFVHAPTGWLPGHYFWKKAFFLLFKDYLKPIHMVKFQNFNHGKDVYSIINVLWPL